MCQPHDEQAVLNYLDWQKLYGTEKPFQLFSVVGGGHLPDQRTTNLVFKEGEVETIHDVRGTESHYSLNKQGFTFRIYPTRVHDFGVRDEVENVYLPEMEELLRREVEGVDQVYFFDWRVCQWHCHHDRTCAEGEQIRKNVELTGKTAIDANDKMQYLLPAKHVHIGRSPCETSYRTGLRSISQTRPLQPFWVGCGCIFPNRRIFCFRVECVS